MDTQRVSPDNLPTKPANKWALFFMQKEKAIKRVVGSMMFVLTLTVAAYASYYLPHFLYLIVLMCGGMSYFWFLWVIDPSYEVHKRERVKVGNEQQSIGVPVRKS